MPYDTGLAQRLEEILQDYPDMIDKKMFGGICWMLSGNICVGVYKEWLIVRVGTEVASTIFKEHDVKPMDFTGKVMKGWAMVGGQALKADQALRHYIDLAIDFVQTLPPK